MKIHLLHNSMSSWKQNGCKAKQASILCDWRDINPQNELFCSQSCLQTIRVRDWKYLFSISCNVLIIHLESKPKPPNIYKNNLTIPNGLALPSICRCFGFDQVTIWTGMTSPDYRNRWDSITQVNWKWILSLFVIVAAAAACVHWSTAMAAGPLRVAKQTLYKIIILRNKMWIMANVALWNIYKILFFLFK